MSEQQSTSLYICTSCNQTFSARGIRDSHQRKCNKADVIKIGQQSYILVHNSENQYICLSPQCNKTYTTKENLRRHLKIYPDHIPQVKSSANGSRKNNYS